MPARRSTRPTPEAVVKVGPGASHMSRAPTTTSTAPVVRLRLVLVTTAAPSGGRYARLIYPRTRGLQRRLRGLPGWQGAPFAAYALQATSKRHGSKTGYFRHLLVRRDVPRARRFRSCAHF